MVHAGGLGSGSRRADRADAVVVNLREEIANYDRGTAMNCRFYLTREEVEGLRSLAKSLPKDSMVQPVPGVLQPRSHDPTTKFTGPYLPDITLILYAPWLTERPLAVSHPWENPGFESKLDKLMMWAEENSTAPIIRAKGDYWTAK